MFYKRCHNRKDPHARRDGQRHIRVGVSDAADAVVDRRDPVEMVARLLEGFLDPAPPGGWIDRIDTSGKSLSPDIPASSLYHLAGAAAAIDTHIAMV